jgi:diapolycopene oxygenase
MQDVFDYFIKYVGSSAYHSPAFMNCLPTIQFRYDLWYVDGGLYNIALGLQRLMNELGIVVCLNSEVTEVRKEGDRVTGLVANGQFHPADIVVSNMEVIPAYEKLLREDEPFLRTLDKYEPSCSGLVLELGIDCQYPQLAHHNFFFSEHQREHFHTVFRKRQLPPDPTIYLVSPSRTDPSQAPAGCENLKILPHVPYVQDKAFTKKEYAQFRERVLDKLERMGLTDLRKHIITEDEWTPEDIQKRYYSNGGAIYGIVSDRKKNRGFKAPKKSEKYKNLYFVGGSVNPGGGMPMVTLSGQQVRDKVLKDYP